MNPQQPNQPPQPTPNGPNVPQPSQPPANPDAFGMQPPITTPQTAQPEPLQPEQPASRSRRKRVGLLLIIGPTALIIISIAVYAIINFITSGASESSMFGDQSGFAVFLNVLLFLIGGVSVLAWLPCLIIGIVLLATPKK